MTKLVIVESPAKAKTINKYLGEDYQVLASYGHVRDLVPKEGAVDPEHGFQMRYAIIERNEKHVNAIAKATRNADAVLLATDPDREGEAIAWHLLQLLNERGVLGDKPVQRVVFHEITRRAVAEAIAHPRTVSDDLVDAQQARRALDYLVGFNLSPLLWRKIQRGLSAGRVQSPALRLIAEREDEIDAFEPREYWTVAADAAKDGRAVAARLSWLRGEKVGQFTLTDAAAAEAARAHLLQVAEGRLRVVSVERKQRRRNPSPPFITSTLQQEAARKLGFTARKTMRTAQDLYEGIDIGGETVGLITYMRTDSVTLSGEAITALRSLIGERYGAEALPDQPRVYKTRSKNAQEAHEAVRPTDVYRDPAALKARLSSDQLRLYELIWKRTVASQMQPAVYDTVAVDLKTGGVEGELIARSAEVGDSEHFNASEKGGVFRATGQTLVSPGFIAVYQEGRDEKSDEDEDRDLPPLAEGEQLELRDVLADQHFTEPPPRYTEASLVKALEEFGIGRPSTYASIISTLVDREYVQLEGKRFFLTDVGRIVARFLTQYFTQYVDYEFTARLEDQLDAISRGEKQWVPLLEEFWQPFRQQVEITHETVSRSDVAQARELGTDPKSSKPVSVRLGRYGPFAQIGSKEDEEKPRFASLRRGQSLDKITLEEALELFKLPRQLGETPEGEPVSTNIGRFGPYVKYGSKFVSLKGSDDPYQIDLPRALELVQEKKAADAARLIAHFEEAGISILRGRYGPYITDGDKNARVPKDREAESLTLEECRELLAAAPAKGARRGRKRTSRAKTPA